MKARTLWLVVPWAIFVLIAVGWIAYWHIAASTAERTLRDWAARENAQGAQVSFGAMVRHGFPALLRLEVQDISYASARGGWTAATARADVHVQLLNPQHVIAEAKAPISLRRRNGAVTNITAENLIASVRMDARTLAQAGVEADALVLDDPAQEGTLTAQKVVINLRPDARTAGEYQLAFDAQNLNLPRPVRGFESFGLEVPTLRMAIVVQEAAALAQTAPEDPLGPWREAGGRLIFEALLINWGPLETTGTGDGGLDAQRRLEGRLVIPVDEPAPVISSLANGPNVSDDARRALGYLAAGYVVTGDDVTLDVSAHDGIMRIEGIPVRPLQPVY
jgi:hypothetical protein